MQAAAPSRLQPVKSSQRTSPACGDLSTAVEAPRAAASTPTATSRQPPAGTPQHQGSGKASTAQDTSRSQPTPGRGCHLNAGHLAQLDTSTRGALQPLRLPHPRTRLHPRACAVGELGEICPGTGASAATSTGEGPTADTGRPPTRASLPSWTPQRPCRSCRNSVGCSQPAPPLDTSRPGLAGEPCRTPQRRPLAGHEKSTKPAEMVRNLVRKNANLLKISVFCGDGRTKTPIKLRKTAEKRPPC